MKLDKASLIPVLLALAAIVTSVPPAAGQVRYSITELGTLGGAFSDATGINAFGDICGRADTGALDATGQPLQHGFVWSGGVLYDLGTLPGGAESFAGFGGINAGAQIAGFADTGATNSSGESIYHAVLWDPSGVLYDLGTLGGEFSVAEGINDLGQATGEADTGAFDANGNPVRHAFLGDSGGLQNLGGLNGYTSSMGWAVNASGQVTGYGYSFPDANGNNVAQAFLWSAATGMQPLPGLGGAFSIGLSINAAGHAAGYADTANGAFEAVAWKGGAVTNLGPLPGDTSSAGYGINNLDQVVGFSRTPGPRPDLAVLYSGETVTDLNTLISPTSGWTLNYGEGINDSGWIVGRGTIAGEERGFLLTPYVLTALSLNPSTVPGSKSATGKLLLNAAAPFNIDVAITSANPAVTVPASVIIPAGKTSQTFTLNTTAVFTKQTGTITGSYGGVTLSRTFTVRPIGVKTLSLAPDPVVSGNPVTGTVTLECPAAPGNITVTLSSSNPAVAKPTAASITIPAGQTGGSFAIQTFPVPAAISIKITAMANGIARSQTLTVNPQ